MFFILAGCTNSAGDDKNNSKPSSTETKQNKFVFANDQKLKLNRLQNKAKAQGVILTNPNDIIRGKWIVNNDTFKVEMKLISDFSSLENSQGESFRLKIKNGSYQGVRVLNLYPVSQLNPKNQLFIHHLAQKMGLLSPRSGIVSLTMDNRPTKDYYWEEHFEKQILESQNCREAPILKLDIRPYKELLLKEKNEKLNFNIPLISQVDILPFSRKKTFSSPTLKAQFVQGNSLLEQLRQGDIEDISNIIDLEKLAKMYFLKDHFMGESMPIPWYNLRFYYNPLTAKLEPIIYRINSPSSDSRVVDESKIFENTIRNTNEFKAVFAQVQQKMNGGALQKLVTEINDSNPEGAPFSWTNAPEKTDNIHSAEKFVPQYEPIPSLALQVVDVGNGKLQITNRHTLPLEILGTGIESGIVTTFNKTIAPKANMVVNSENPIIYYRVKNRNTIYQYRHTQPQIPSRSIGQKIRNSAKIPSGFKKMGDTLIYIGQHQIYQQDIILPKGYAVFFPKGSVLELENCSFLSFSPIFAKGTSEDPVLFYSNNAKGFTIIDAESRSELTYTTFDKFGNQQFEGWTLPGAVTFNQSDVFLNHCIFSNNTCEDALNVVRSDFDVENCTFSNTFGDAFDADFCTGKVSGCTFKNIGNDAIDYSGSTISIENCDITQCGDKGVSSGEHSNLVVRDIRIDGAVIGIASKDKSKVKASGIALKNCDRNFAVFQKKKEYGPAEIEAEGKEISPANKENIVDKNSVLILNNKKTVGKKSIDVDALYQ